MSEIPILLATIRDASMRLQRKEITLSEYIEVRKKIKDRIKEIQNETDRNL